MNNLTKKNSSRIIYLLIGAFVMLLILITCVILAARSLSWFTVTKDVSAENLSITVSVSPDLIVRVASVSDTPPGSNVGDYQAPGAVEGIDFETAALSFEPTSAVYGVAPSPEPEIEPGSAGSFKLYLENVSSNDIFVNFNTSAECDQLIGDTFAYVYEYANHHIVFSYKIDGIALTENSCTIEPETEYELTVEWEWVVNYNTLVAKGIVPNADNYENYFYGITDFSAATNEIKSNAYNNADLFIAVYMTPMFFHIEFS